MYNNINAMSYWKSPEVYNKKSAQIEKSIDKNIY